MIESSSYKELYSRCEAFLCDYLALDRNVLRDFTRQLFDTPTLRKYYTELINHAAVSSETVAICDADEFIHIIDHYDDHIHLLTRDKTGSYYTPAEIIDLMMDKLFEEPSFNQKIKMRESFVLLEPSCGTMVFVRAFAERLFNETNDRNYLKDIMRKLHVIDLQVEPLFLGILGVIFKIYPLTKSLDFNWKVRSCDTLQVTDLNNSVDVVLGNPPYLGEKGNAEFFRGLKVNPLTAPYYEGRMDLYYFFIHFAINVLKEEGLLSFITTNYFITADSAKVLRKRLFEEVVFKQITDYSGDGLFKSARGQHNVSFLIQKTKESTSCKLTKIAQLKSGALQSVSESEIDEKKLYDNKGLIALTSDPLTYELLQKIYESSTGELSDVFDVKQGIVSGADFVTKSMLEKKLDEADKTDIQKGDPIYVFEKEGIEPFKGPWQNFYKNSDIQKYKIHAAAKFLIYYVDEHHLPTEDGLAHLSRFKSVLDKRREVKLGYRKWYELQWPRTAELFEQAKLVMPQRSRRNVFAYSDTAFYGSADIYYIIHGQKDKEALLYLNGVINSKLYYFWLYHRGKKKGELLELYSTPIKSLPMIHYTKLAWQEAIIDKIKCLMALEELQAKEIEAIAREIDSIIYEGFSLSDDEINRVENFYKKIDQRG